MKKMKYTMMSVALIMILISPLSAGVLKQHGIGAKAKAMGGAFVGLADDFSALYWNPGGLCQVQEKCLFISAAPVISINNYIMDALAIDTGNISALDLLGTIGYVKPLSEKVVMGIYVNDGPLVGAKWNNGDFAPLFGSTTAQFSGSLKDLNVSPGVSYNLNQYFKIGASLNIHYTRWGLEVPSFMGQYSETLNGVGVGATVGLFSESFLDACTFGITFKTPVKIKLSGDATMSGQLSMPNPQSGAEREITLPMWIGVGLALKTYKRFWTTFDIHYVQWSKVNDVAVVYDDDMWNRFVDGTMPLKWKSCTQIRLGFEYKASNHLAIRAGYCKDPVSAQNSSLNLIFPVKNTNWITCGFGYRSEKLTIDASLEFALPGKLAMEIEALDYDDLNYLNTYRQTATKKISLGSIEATSIIPTVTLTYRF